MEEKVLRFMKRFDRQELGNDEHSLIGLVTRGTASELTVDGNIESGVAIRRGEALWEWKGLNWNEEGNGVCRLEFITEVEM